MRTPSEIPTAIVGHGVFGWERRETEPAGRLYRPRPCAAAGGCDGRPTRPMTAARSATTNTRAPDGWTPGREEQLPPAAPARRGGVASEGDLAGLLSAAAEGADSRAAPPGRSPKWRGRRRGPPPRTGPPARRARKHAAATAVDALAGSALVVELGEVRGEDWVLARPAVEPGIKASERAGIEGTDQIPPKSPSPTHASTGSGPAPAVVRRGRRSRPRQPARLFIPRGGGSPTPAQKFLRKARRRLTPAPARAQPQAVVRRGRRSRPRQPARLFIPRGGGSPTPAQKFVCKYTLTVTHVELGGVDDAGEDLPAVSRLQ